MSFFDFVLFNNASFLFKEVFFGKFLLDCIFFLFDFLNGVAFKSSFFFSFYGQHFILFLFRFFFDQLIFFFDSCSFGGNHIFDNNLFSSLSLSNSYRFKSRFKRDSFVLSERNIFSFSLKDVNLLRKRFLIKQIKFIIDSLFKGDNRDFFNFFSFGSFSGIFDFSVNLFVLSFLFFSLDFSFFFFYNKLLYIVFFQALNSGVFFDDFCLKISNWCKIFFYLFEFFRYIGLTFLEKEFSFVDLMCFFLEALLIVLQRRSKLRKSDRMLLNSLIDFIINELNNIASNYLFVGH